jgi:transcription initiation factor IIF auxiliary subunit
MSYRIEQSYQYEGEDWWRWSVWLEGSDEELDQVEYVQYTLHRTFPKPVRRVHDRASKFRLGTGGWGTFTIYVLVVRKDRGEVKLSHELQLHYPNGASAPE